MQKHPNRSVLKISTFLSSHDIFDTVVHMINYSYHTQAEVFKERVLNYLIDSLKSSLVMWSISPKRVKDFTDLSAFFFSNYHYRICLTVPWPWPPNNAFFIPAKSLKTKSHLQFHSPDSFKFCILVVQDCYSKLCLNGRSHCLFTAKKIFNKPFMAPGCHYMGVFTWTRGRTFAIIISWIHFLQNAIIRQIQIKKGNILHLFDQLWSTQPSLKVFKKCDV